MSSLQLIAFFQMENREELPENLHAYMLDKCAYIIQKGWRHSWLYRKKYICKIVNEGNLTKKCCQQFLYKQLQSPTIREFLTFLHAFFLANKEDDLNPDVVDKIIRGIRALSGTNAHRFFCMLNTVINKPEQIIMDWRHFSDLMNSFSRESHNKMVRFEIEK
jgi:hypothetical protein